MLKDFVFFPLWWVRPGLCSIILSAIVSPFSYKFLTPNVTAVGFDTYHILAEKFSRYSFNSTREMTCFSPKMSYLKPTSAHKRRIILCLSQPLLGYSLWDNSPLCNQASDALISTTADIVLDTWVTYKNTLSRLPFPLGVKWNSNKIQSTALDIQGRLAPQVSYRYQNL